MKTISLKRNCIMNEMRKLADEFNNLGIEKHQIMIVETEIQVRVELRNAGYNIIFAKGAGSISSGIETMQKSKIHYTKRIC
jgi:hypothetical protein